MSDSKMSNTIDTPAESWTERIVLENESLRVVTMPALGGKIASIQIVSSGEELLQQPLMPYAPRVPYMRFDDSDASGWDECLPSVAACNVQTSSGAVCVPDHGDFWQVAWEVDAQSDKALTLSAEGLSLPLRFSKTLSLNDNRLLISYNVKNIGEDETTYIWSAHPLFAAEAGDRIVLPSSVREVTVEGSGKDRLGTNGAKHRWPQTTLPNGEACDLATASGITKEIGDKLFTNAPAEGWCALERTRLKQRIEIHFDAQVMPYLGLWICYGGWPEGRAKRQQCVALEPCFSIGDSLESAAAENRARTIAPGGEERWTVELRLTRVS
jgi:galactose mutarotase-like enzyme